MITALWTILTTNKLARTLGIAVMAVLGVLTFGAVKKREGAQDQKAKQDAANAKAHTETVERVLDETTSADPADDIRRRMRERAGKS